MIFHLLDQSLISESNLTSLDYLKTLDFTHIRLPVILVSFCLLALYFRLTPKSVRLNLPPGPRSLPLIGNLYQDLGKSPLDILQKHHSQYGPIISLQLGQCRFVSINSHELAHELIDKRSAKYASRPTFASVEIFGDGLLFPLMPMGDRWRSHQKAAGKLLNASQKYHPLQELESCQLLHDLLSGEDLSKSFHRYAGSFAFSLIYGSRLESVDCEEIRLAHEFVDGMNDGVNGTQMALPELFPVMKKLPYFLAPWKKAAQSLHGILDAFFVENYKTAKARSSWSWTTQLGGIKESQSMGEKEQSFMMGALYAAGFETTPSTFMYFVLACVLYPECCARAQKELDEIVGSGRLPNFEDRSKLPYIEAMILEVLRWRPILPLGIPYSTQQDDEYKVDENTTYHIPKDTPILVNMWGIAFDEKTFPDPYEFRPERWLDNPEGSFNAFGYGRRSCPGRRMAVDSLFIVFSRLLWTYDIGHLYQDGEKVPVNPWGQEIRTAALPDPVPSSFTIRSPVHRDVLEKEWMHIEKDSHTILEQIREETGTRAWA